MAYTHSKYEVIMLTTANNAADLDLTTATTAFIARWNPGTMPHLIRGGSVVFTVNTASDVSSGSVIIQKVVPVFTGTDTATNIATITFPTTLSLSTQPVIFFSVTDNIEITPGQGVNAIMGTVATTGIRGMVTLYVEPRWETHANLPLTIQTT